MEGFSHVSEKDIKTFVMNKRLDIIQNAKFQYFSHIVKVLSRSWIQTQITRKQNKKQSHNASADKK